MNGRVFAQPTKAGSETLKTLYDFTLAHRSCGEGPACPRLFRKGRTTVRVSEPNANRPTSGRTAADRNTNGCQPEKG